MLIIDVPSSLSSAPLHHHLTITCHHPSVITIIFIHSEYTQFCTSRQSLKYLIWYNSHHYSRDYYLWYGNGSQDFKGRKSWNGRHIKHQNEWLCEMGVWEKKRMKSVTLIIRSYNKRSSFLCEKSYDKRWWWGYLNEKDDHNFEDEDHDWINWGECQSWIQGQNQFKLHHIRWFEHDCQNHVSLLMVMMMILFLFFIWWSPSDDCIV